MRPGGVISRRSDTILKQKKEKIAQESKYSDRKKEASKPLYLKRYE
jgi:hypothetical protein